MNSRGYLHCNDLNSACASAQDLYFDFEEDEVELEGMLMLDEQ